MRKRFLLVLIPMALLASACGGNPRTRLEKESTEHETCIYERVYVDSGFTRKVKSEKLIVCIDKGRSN